ncbi:MAG: hypothetical protein IKW28_10055, partial [Lachnospiraceae bacterium]|nr:hypothetical protein [Lachnospiraceae bacterium]
VTTPTSVEVKEGKTTLVEGQDYIVSYENCGKVGTALVKITGCGNYSGTKSKTYQITGSRLTAKMVQQLDHFVYDGSIKQVQQGQNYILTDQTGKLIQGKDYQLSYSGDRINAGKFKVTFRGVNEYSGSVTKTFTIAKASAKQLQVNLKGSDKVSYSKNGAAPKPEVSFKGQLLTEGKDYVISYGNHKKVADKKDKKAPFLYITGIGNFTGSTKSTPVKFTIRPAALALHTKLTVSDIAYKNAKKNYVPTIVLTDLESGKKLTKNTDYSSIYSYQVWDESLGDYRALSADRVTEADFSMGRIYMRITLSGCQNYSGEITREYEIYKRNIATATVDKIGTEVYTGKEITPEVRVYIKVKEGNEYKTVRVEPQNYDLKYENNIRKGTATVYIYGRGEYGGVKKVTFKIKEQKMKWWDFWEN